MRAYRVYGSIILSSSHLSFIPCLHFLPFAHFAPSSNGLSFCDSSFPLFLLFPYSSVPSIRSSSYSNLHPYPKIWLQLQLTRFIIQFNFPFRFLTSSPFPVSPFRLYIFFHFVYSFLFYRLSIMSFICISTKLSSPPTIISPSNFVA